MKTLCRTCLLLLAVATHVAYAADSQGVVKTKLAMDFLRDIRQATFIEHDEGHIRAVAERYIAPDYIQHSEDYGTGREGFIAKMSSFATAGKNQPPMPAPQIMYSQADGDLVVWVAKIKRPDPKDATKMIDMLQFNMVRIANGKLAEHWSAQ